MKFKLEEIGADGYLFLAYHKDVLIHTHGFRCESPHQLPLIMAEDFLKVYKKLKREEEAVLCP